MPVTDDTCEGLILTQGASNQISQQEFMSEYPINDIVLVIHYPQFRNHRTLIKEITETEEMTTTWLKENGFLAKDLSDCPDCAENGRNGKLKYYKTTTEQRRKGNLILQCTGEGNKCRKRYSPFSNTFFDGDDCKIDCYKVLEIIYFWATKTPVTRTSEETGVCINTVVDYYNFCREVCLVSLSKNENNVIGGEGLTVEIDEN